MAPRKRTEVIATPAPLSFRKSTAGMKPMCAVADTWLVRILPNAPFPAQECPASPLLDLHGHGELGSRDRTPQNLNLARPARRLDQRFHCGHARTTEVTRSRRMGLSPKERNMDVDHLAPETDRGSASRSRGNKPAYLGPNGKGQLFYARNQSPNVWQQDDAAGSFTRI